jgi:hypothetical protein
MRATTRAVRSVVPPAPEGATISIARSGFQAPAVVAAFATPNAAKVTTNDTNNNRETRIIAISPMDFM